MKKALVILGLVLLTLFSFIPVHAFNGSNTTLATYPTNAGNPFYVLGTFPNTNCDPVSGCSVSVTFLTGQSFAVIRESYSVNTITFNINRGGSPTCTLRADIFTVTTQSLAGIPSSSTPLGSSATRPCSGIATGTNNPYDFTFTTGQVPISYGTFYAAALTVASNSTVMSIAGGNWIQVLGATVNDPTAGGVAFWKPSTWTATGPDPLGLTVTGDPISQTQTNIGNGIVIGSSFFTLMYLGLGGAFAVSTIGLAFAIVGGRAKQDVRLPLTIMLVGIVSFVGLGIILLIAAQFSGIFKGQGL